jgi:hypothetical protein
MNEWKTGNEEGWSRSMIAIRIPKSQWGKAWRAMIELAPVRLVAGDPVYEVSPAHIELLIARGFTYEVVRPSSPAIQRPKPFTC